MGTVPPPTFTGISKFANDFQQVLNRAVQIASLPLQNMENELNTLTNQQSALLGLQSAFAPFEAAILNLGTAAQGSVAASVSNPSVLQATATSSALPGTYTVEVTSLGSSTSTLSKVGLTTVTDPSSQNISSATSFKLTINGADHTITPSGGSLQDLAGAINGAGLGVSATIVNLGSSSSPDYRLAVTSNNLAPDTIQLNDGTHDLLDTPPTLGSPATYRVNGLTTDIPSNSRTITLAPGLTVDLLQASPGNPVTITVAQSNAPIQNALNSFVSSYNAAADSLTQQHGQNGGALNGQSLVFSLGQALQSVVQYTGGSGTVTSLADLGITLDSTGHLNFDSTALSSHSTADIQQFLGSVSSGGFLQRANSAITSMEDPTTGAIHGNYTSITNEITRQGDHISTETDRINNLEATLQQRLSSADAAIAVLQQQVTFMSSLFATMYPNSGNSNIGNSNNSIGG
jgi:flagellar hook-associated protein 2